MPQPTDELQFEHATYEKAPTGVSCATCGKPVGGEYWQWGGRVVCATCRDALGRFDANAKSPATFLRAALLATGAAAACGVGYAVFVGLTHIQFALITIGIAYVVATVTLKVTHNVGGRRYQVLAAMLTYAASTMGYAPDVWRSIRGGAEVSLRLFGVLLAAPFLVAKEAPIGLLIIGFGLWEAWRRAGGRSMAVAGPFRVAAGGAGAPPRP